MNKLKICGIRSLEEIYELCDLDIHYFGCIFAESPRKVSPELARDIVSIIHKHQKKAVGVFVNSSIEEIKQIRNFTNLDIIQLHGDESPEFCRTLGGKIWKVFRISDKIPDINIYKKYIEYPLFDTKGKAHGGNGIIFNWTTLKHLGYQYVLAGGLSEDNIKSALKYNPAVLDINSKVEIDNKKNRDKILNIIKLLNNERKKYE